MAERLSDTENDRESDIEFDSSSDKEETQVNDLGGGAGDNQQVPAANVGGAADVADWSAEPADITVQDFQQQPGPRHNLGPATCPRHFFFLMFLLTLIEHFDMETNNNADKCIEVSPNSAWFPTTLEEMRAFLAIQIMFGIKSLPQLWMYWSEDRRFHDSWNSGIMPITRLKNLSRYFHCRDTTNAPLRGEPGFGPLYKVRNVIEATQATFRASFEAGRKLSVDESMVTFKGRLANKQYMPAKPTKWGIKIWTVTDARLDYCLGYDVYTGKASRRDPRRPLGFEVVDTLCAPQYGQGHHVYVDRFFNSVDLAEHLLTKGTFLCGTIMSSRKGLPAFMKRKLKTRGEESWSSNRDGTWWQQPIKTNEQFVFSPRTKQWELRQMGVHTS